MKIHPNDEILKDAYPQKIKKNNILYRHPSPRMVRSKHSYRSIVRDHFSQRCIFCFRSPLFNVLNK